MTTAAPKWMAIVNLSPDSFSQDGLDSASLPARLDTLFESPADILDIGAVSTRPGSDEVPWQTEWSRLAEAWQPVSEFKARRAHAGRPVRISIDTSSPIIADRAAQTGVVDIINDVYAGRKWEDGRNTFDVAGAHGCGLAISHMPENVNPKNMQERPHYGSCLDEVISFLEAKVSAARAAGVQEIWIDPGIGFGKRLEHNLELLSRAAFERYSGTVTPSFRDTQLLIGVSRKRFLYEHALLTQSEHAEALRDPPARDKVTKIWEQRCISMASEVQNSGHEMQLIIRSHTVPIP